EGGLGHANVGFDPGNGDMAHVPAVELLEKLRDRAAVERRLGRPIRYQVGDRGCGGPEALRILLGGPGWYFQQLGAADQSDQFRHDSLVVRNQVQEFVLHVDGQERGVMAGPSLSESHGGSPASEFAKSGSSPASRALSKRC